MTRSEWCSSFTPVCSVTALALGQGRLAVPTSVHHAHTALTDTRQHPVRPDVLDADLWLDRPSAAREQPRFLGLELGE